MRPRFCGPWSPASSPAKAIGTLLITTVASLIKSRYDEDSADATPLDQPVSADKPELEPVDAVDR